MDLIAAAESLSAKQATSVFVKQAVRKHFKPDPGSGFEGGWFDGAVKRVDRDLRDQVTREVLQGLLFLIEYDDGDTEHVLLEELVDLLVDPTSVHQKIEALQRRPNGSDGIAGLPSAAAAALAAEASTPTGPPAGPLARASASQRQAKLTGEDMQRHLRRAVKRPAQDDYETDGSQQRKRAASAAGPSRLGMHAPAGAAAAAGMVTESEEAVPLGEGGMRLVGLPGHVKSIELINFMCHEHMSMEFGPHVTFVSGTNGSGKSATLQALQVCLGVKASRTGRAASAKGFIRDGASEAVVRVTLWNRPYKGHDAFQHHIYGDAVTVERRIGAAAQSWALKDAQGRKRAQRRDDLDALLSTLSLNAANPITVMTQDTVKQFLAGSSSKSDQEKYDLYMQATQLGAIAESLLTSKMQIAQMDENVSKLREDLEKLEQRRAGLAQAVGSLRGLEEWRREQAQLECVLVWLFVDQMAATVAELEAVLAGSVPERQAAAEAEAEALAREVDALGEATKQKGAFLETFTANAERLGGSEAEARASVKEAHKRVGLLQKKLARMEARATEEAERKEGLEAAAKEAAGEEAAATQAVTQQYADQLYGAQGAHKEAAGEVERATAEYAKAEARCNEAAGALESVKGAEAHAHAEVASLQRDAEAAKAAARGAGRDALAKFGGAPMVSLAAAVDSAAQRGRFHAKPVGPIGRYLSLSDPRWGRAVEAAIGRDLSTFLVTDQHDCGVLTQLINQHGPHGYSRPRICVMRLDLPRHAVPAHQQPRADVPTVLRVLSCSDPSVDAPVMNYLVDQGRCEKTALGASADEGRRLARERNVSNVYVVDGSRRFVRHNSEMHEPEPSHLRNKPARLGTTPREASQQLAAALAAAQQELRSAQGAVAEAQGAVDAAADASRAARKRLGEFKSREAKAQHQVHTLLSQIPAEVEATQDGGEGGLHREILAATQAVAELEEQTGGVRTQLAAAQAAAAEAGAALAALQAEMKRLEEENSEFVSSYEAESEALAAAQQRLVAAKDTLRQLEAVRAEKQAQLARARADLDEHLALAPRLCSREEAAEARAAAEERLRAKRLVDEQVALFFTREVLQKKISALRDKIGAAERQAGGALEELEEQLAAAEGELAGRGARAKQAIRVHADLKHAWRRRNEKLKQIDMAVESLVNARFNQYMRRKGHMGRLKLDRANHSLSLSVQVGAGAVKDLKQLSGGERSYTTVAFTLALGSETDMPFRAMDEFDVFMDSVNRRVAMENLLMFAREQGELQFVFLTPQDMAAVEAAREQCARAKQPIPDRFVKTVVMRPARANATRA